VLELGRPVVVALNQIDMARAAGVAIDVPELIHELGATVIPTIAKRGEGIEQLRRAIVQAPTLPLPERRFALPAPLAAALAPVHEALVGAGLAPAPARMEALRLLALDVPEAHLRDVGGLPALVDEARATLRAAATCPSAWRASCATAGSAACSHAASCARRAPRGR
jgi:ferrous iron transport protein B